MLDTLKNLANDILSKIKMLSLKLCAQRTLKRSLFSMLSLHRLEILKKLLGSPTFVSFHFRSLSHKIQRKVLRQFIVLLKTKLTLLFIQSPPLFIPLDLKAGPANAALGVCCESLERSLATISHWSSCSYHDKRTQTPSSSRLQLHRETLQHHRLLPLHFLT